MGTIHIEWNKIAHISSLDSFEIELSNGERFFGSISTSTDDRKLLVSGAKARGVFNMSSIIRIAPLEATFLDRLKGKLNLGFDYKKAHKSIQFSLGGNLSYRTVKYMRKLEFESSLDDRDDVERTSRNKVSFDVNRFLGLRWFLKGSIKYEMADEMDLNSRYTLALSGGRYMLQTNRMLFSADGGLQGTREVFFSSDEITWNLEALFVGEFSIFKYDNPETDISSKLEIIPSLTDWGRYRIHFNIDLSYEIYSDLFLGLTFFDDYDSKPPAEADTEKNDFGVTTSIGYSL